MSTPVTEALSTVSDYVDAFRDMADKAIDTAAQSGVVLKENQEILLASINAIQVHVAEINFLHADLGRSKNSTHLMAAIAAVAAIMLIVAGVFLLSNMATLGTASITVGAVLILCIGGVYLYASPAFRDQNLEARRHPIQLPAHSL